MPSGGRISYLLENLNLYVRLKNNGLARREHCCPAFRPSNHSCPPTQLLSKSAAKMAAFHWLVNVALGGAGTMVRLFRIRYRDLRSSCIWFNLLYHALPCLLPKGKSFCANLQVGARTNICTKSHTTLAVAPLSLPTNSVFKCTDTTPTSRFPLFRP